MAPGRTKRPAGLSAPSPVVAASNVLHVGDNATVLRELRREFEGVFKCAYLDPPYNTGRTFDEYRDVTAPAEWASSIEACLEGVKPLLALDGALFVEIDDSELASVIRGVDLVFGRAQRISVITVVRSAATGHKAENRGPVNVADYLVLAAKSRAHFRPQRLYRVRREDDRAYATFLANPEDPPDRWTFCPLGEACARALGFTGRAAATKALGREVFATKRSQFARDRARHVVRFAQPRFEAVSQKARELIELSRRSPDEVLRLDRPGRRPLLLRGGNRILFLADKIADVGGAPALVEPLTNVWDDVPFQGIAKEGGVSFSRNKKPERLMKRLLDMTTSPGDWVLDPFAGSGTMPAVAQKMGRRWVAIEREPTLVDRATARLTRVVRGEDPTGITRQEGWTGGGNFRIQR